MQQPLNEKTVRHVAELARLSLSDDELTRYADQLSKILQYVDQLSEVDTSDVAPTAHPIPIRNVFRSDEVSETMSADHALHNAPDRQDDFFKVPKVLNQENA